MEASEDTGKATAAVAKRPPSHVTAICLSSDESDDEVLVVGVRAPIRRRQNGTSDGIRNSTDRAREQAEKLRKFEERKAAAVKESAHDSDDDAVVCVGLRKRRPAGMPKQTEDPEREKEQQDKLKRFLQQRVKQEASLSEPASSSRATGAISASSCVASPRMSAELPAMERSATPQTQGLQQQANFPSSESSRREIAAKSSLLTSATTTARKSTARKRVHPARERRRATAPSEAPDKIHQAEPSSSELSRTAEKSTSLSRSPAGAALKPFATKSAQLASVRNPTPSPRTRDSCKQTHLSSSESSPRTAAKSPLFSAPAKTTTKSSVRKRSDSAVKITDAAPQTGERHRQAELPSSDSSHLTADNAALFPSPAKTAPKSHAQESANSAAVKSAHASPQTRDSHRQAEPPSPKISARDAANSNLFSFPVKTGTKAFARKRALPLLRPKASADQQVKPSSRESYPLRSPSESMLSTSAKKTGVKSLARKSVQPVLRKSAMTPTTEGNRSPQRYSSAARLQASPLPSDRSAQPASQRATPEMTVSASLPPHISVPQRSEQSSDEAEVIDLMESDDDNDAKPAAVVSKEQAKVAGIDESDENDGEADDEGDEDNSAVFRRKTSYRPPTPPRPKQPKGQQRQRQHGKQRKHATVQPGAPSRTASGRKLGRAQRLLVDRNGTSDVKKENSSSSGDQCKMAAKKTISVTVPGKGWRKQRRVLVPKPIVAAQLGHHAGSRAESKARLAVRRQEYKEAAQEIMEILSDDESVMSDTEYIPLADVFSESQIDRLFKRFRIETARDLVKACLDKSLMKDKMLEGFASMYTKRVHELEREQRDRLQYGGEGNPIVLDDFDSDSDTSVEFVMVKSEEKQPTQQVTTTRPVVVEVPDTDSSESDSSVEVRPSLKSISNQLRRRARPTAAKSTVRRSPAKTVLGTASRNASSWYSASSSDEESTTGQPTQPKQHKPVADGSDKLALESPPNRASLGEPRNLHSASKTSPAVEHADFVVTRGQSPVEVRSLENGNEIIHLDFEEPTPAEVFSLENGNEIIPLDSKVPTDAPSVMSGVARIDRKTSSANGPLRDAVGNSRTDGAAADDERSIGTNESSIRGEEFTPNKMDSPTNHMKNNFERRPMRKTSRPDRFVVSHSSNSGLTKPEAVLSHSHEDGPILVDEEAVTSRLPEDQMQIIPTLSWESTKNGRPAKFFMVMNSKDETLYSFKAWVGKSKIPGAGLGCFLKFFGSYVLNAEQWSLSRRRMRSVVGWVPETMEVLQAEGATLTLTGRHLHSRFNLPYFEKNFDELDPKAYGLKDDDVMDKRFGFLKNHTLIDYEFVPDATFHSYRRGCGTIELGRYGALRKSDRKTKEIFDLKTFLFDHSPTEWPFEVEEQLDGRPQLIDFTDDATGEPHEDACRSLPKHVNETGHDPSKAQNVQILSRDEDCRNVFYYICIEPSQTMEAGQTVELLANYGETYEPNRERQGYGLRNLQEGLGGDNDFVAKFRRDDEDRIHVAAMIDGYTDVEFMEAFIFLCYIVFPKVKAVTDPFVTGTERSVSARKPSKYQIVARRRMHWIAPLLRKRLQTCAPKPGGLDDLKAALLGRHRMPWVSDELRTRLLAQKFDHKGVFDALGKMHWPLCEGRHHKPTDAAIRNFVTEELRRETLTEVGKRLVLQLDTNMWCPYARELTTRLCDVVSFEAENNRLELFLRETIAAGYKVRKACDEENPPNDLEFRGTAQEICWHCFEEVENWAFFDPSSTADKGVMAQAAEYLAYRDAVALGLDTPIDLRQFVVPVAATVFVGEEADGSGVPRQKQHFTSGKGKLHTHWYLTWQVAFVANAFVSRYAPSEARSFLRTLCERLGMNYESTLTSLEVGILVNVVLPVALSFSSRPTGRRRELTRKRMPGPTAIRRRRDESANLGHDRSSQKEKREWKRGREPQRGKKSRTGDSAPARKKRKKIGKQEGSSAKKRSGAPSESKMRNFLFWTLLWERLVKEVGWRLETGTRPRDFYFMPPNVYRRPGFSNRKDYFDSVKLLLIAMDQHETWSRNATCRDIMRDFRRCEKKLAEMRAKRQVPPDMTLDWLRGKLN